MAEKTGTEIETVNKAPQPALPPVPRTPRAPAPEKFTLSLVCAKHGKRYELRYVRVPSGKLRLLESVKLESDDRAGLGAMAASQTIPLDDFEDGDNPCAWCGDPNFNGPCYC